jgi:LysR family transcriptional regulator, glycine cleavage system transcriptional activator
MRDINLKATEYFEAVARLGTVTKAAQELGVSPSAVSQQISSLEAQFGVRLFRREKRRLILTLDGDRLFQTTAQAFGALRNARNAIARQRGARALTLRVSPSFGVRWLGPRIAAFAEANPDWNIRIDATPDFTAFETEAVDLDLRYGLGGWTGLTVECVMNDLVLPLCSPDYRDRLHRNSERPAQLLSRARLIDSVKTVYRWDVWLAANRIELSDIEYPFRFDRSSMSIEMAKQGGGVALDNAILCKGELERGELVPLTLDCPVIEFPAYWFVCPPRHLNRRIVKRFLAWVGAQARADQEHVRGLLARMDCRFRDGTTDALQVMAPNAL